MTPSNKNPTDLDSIRDEILAELEQEHQDREQRAHRKAERRKQKRRIERERSKEVEELRAQMRREFYVDKGYEERVDPTGRQMYLSPTELKNKQRRKGRKRRKKSFNLFEWMQSYNLGEWPVYIGIAVLAVVTGILLTRGG
jgi:hypothetical protein